MLLKHNVQSSKEILRTNRHEHGSGSPLAQVEPFLGVTRNEHLEGRYDEAGAELSMYRMSTRREACECAHLGNQNESVCSAYAERSCRSRISHPSRNSEQRSTDIALHWRTTSGVQRQQDRRKPGLGTYGSAQAQPGVEVWNEYSAWKVHHVDASPEPVHLVERKAKLIGG